MTAKFLDFARTGCAGRHSFTKAATLGVVAAFTLIACAPAQKPNSAPAQKASPAPAQQGNAGGGLKFIENPGGGEVVYGPVPTESTMAGAMGVVLRDVHGHFGDKPQIGKFFQSRGGDSVATFFTLKALKQDGKVMTGLVMISMPKGQKPAAAVLFDTSERFPKTEGVLMAKLNEAWQKESVPPPGAAQTSAAPAHGAAVPALHPAAAPDNSASISLPAGWHITGGGGGALQAAGPNGELIVMGNMIQGIYDPQNPRAAQMVRYLNMSHQPVIICPRNTDLVTAYLCVIKQSRAMRNLPPLSLTVSQRTPMQNGGLVVIGEMDQHDGKGVMAAKLQLSAMQEGPAGGWPLTIFAELIPKQLAEQEWPTMNAIAATYRQNGQVIAGQTQQVINQIHQTAAANTALANARSDANDAHNAAVEQQWDDNAKYNKSFENYTLDRSVIQASEEPNAHGTFDNRTADNLVRSNPDKFQYVPTQDLLKGVDY